VFKHIPYGKSRRLYKRLPACAGNASASFTRPRPGLRCKPYRSTCFRYVSQLGFFARLASEHPASSTGQAFDQPPSRTFFNDPLSQRMKTGCLYNSALSSGVIRYPIKNTSVAAIEPRLRKFCKIRPALLEECVECFFCFRRQQHRAEEFTFLPHPGHDCIGLGGFHQPLGRA
jgi:hypothetical protein